MIEETKTVLIFASDQVFAPFGSSGVFLRGKHEVVRVAAVGPDDQTPLAVRQALVDLHVRTVFTKPQLIHQCGIALCAWLPDGCRVTYISWITKALRRAGEIGVARELHHLMPDPLDMYVFEPGTFLVV